MDAVAYLRRSSAPNTGTRTVSFEMQEAAVRELAGRHGDAIDTVLTDWAKSGGSARGRPGYQDMLARIEAGSVRAIYSYSLSRLSRSLLDFAGLLERCRAQNVSIRLVQEGSIDHSNATGRGFAGMVAVFAQMERELAQERNTAAVTERRERGDVMGQAPYGFRIVDGKLTPREGEDPGVVVAAFREAGSFGGAARSLNERGVASRQGKGWTHGVVADILRYQAPTDLAVPLAAKRARTKTLVSTRLARLLRCACGLTLTPRHFQGLTTYYCSRSYRIPDHGKTTVREAALLPWITEEASRLRTPDQLVVETRADQHGVLEAKRGRIIDMYVEGIIDKATRDARLVKVDVGLARLGAQEQILDIPTIDWTWPPATLNTVLRALWDHVQLDVDMRPVSAKWIIPEWRS